MKSARGIFFIVLLYASTIGISVSAVVIGLMAVVKTTTGSSQNSHQEQTLLELRMESVREIQQALARPLPSPEPLPPITARVTHAVRSIVVSPKAHRHEMIDKARDAFAGLEPTSFDIPSSAYAEPDRHAVH
jgi:hypothetical protein